jgi:phosphomannomutase
VGGVREDRDAIERHLTQVLALPMIDLAAIRARRLTVALDCVRGAGGTTIPPLLERLGCTVRAINLETDGRFPRPPEPLPENLGELSRLVKESSASIGLAVDPDVDRLALVDERGEPIGEDYTLALAVRAVLGEGRLEGSAARRLDGRSDGSGRAEPPSGRAGEPPVVVANLSTSLVVEDAARLAGARFVRAPVGEANVARAIRDEGAIIGGEGNGGVILPSLHIGRDAPVGVALILHLLVKTGQTVSGLVADQARYRIVKAKAPRGKDLGQVYQRLMARFKEATPDTRDGLRLAWPDRWVHDRPSGTEPIVRFIAEAPTETDAQSLVAVCRELFSTP